MDELQDIVNDYESILHLLRIQEISDVVDMKIEELSQSDDD